MAETWKEVRVFISSTFKDMQAERDHLVRLVFPRLREEMLKRRIHFVDVDLRWGVTADQDAFDMCMDEIKLCHPRFLCMLGGRYGWVPPPKTVEQKYMAHVLAGASSAGTLAGEERDALREVYALDRSANDYRLNEKPKTKEKVEVWERQRNRAVKVLQRAGHPEVKRSITASEVHFGALDRLDEPTFRYFYFRDPKVTESIPKNHAAVYREETGSVAEKALQALKDRVGKAEGLVLEAPVVEVKRKVQVYEYPCRWDNQARRIVDLWDFGDRVFSDLLASVEAQFGMALSEEIDVYSRENAALEAFIETRLERYVVGSRRPVLDALWDHAVGTGGSGLACIVGDPGSGKSALLGKFYREYLRGTDKRAARSDDLVVAHFIGINATNTRELLRRLCHELATRARLSEEIPADYDGLRKAFPEFLEKAAQGGHVVLLVDAVNELDPTHGAHSMTWLPDRVPENVRVILTALESPALVALRRRREPPTEVPLEALSERDATAIIDGFLKRYRKALDTKQRAALLAKSDAGNPLYLLTALEELRTLGIYEEITDCILELPSEVRPLFNWILKRLEDDPGFRDAEGQHVGEELVGKYVTYLSLGRSGMAQSELVALVAPAQCGASADPQGNVAALRALLLPYLMRRGELLDFFHGQIREAVWERYLKEQEERVTAHREIANYFTEKVDPGSEGGFKGDSLRGLSELPYHLTEAKEWQKLEGTLTNFNFLERKAAEVGVVEMTDAKGKTSKLYTGVFELQGDYDHALAKTNGKSIDAQSECGQVIEAFAGALRQESHNLIERPEILWQQLYNRLQWLVGPKGGELLADTLARELKKRSSKEAKLWMNQINRIGESGPLVRTLVGHTSEVNTCSFCPVDGKILISGSSDGTLRIWDVLTGEEITVLRGHQTEVLSISISPDGRRILSGGADGRLILWDMDTRNTVKVFEGLFGPVYCCTFCPIDGNIFVSGNSDGTLRIWDVATGEEIAILRGHQKEGHYGEVLSCAFSPDGEFLISGSLDDSLRLWDVSTWSEMGTMTSHTAGINTCAFSPDGRLIVSGSWDETIKVWAVAHNQSPIVDNHELAIVGCTFNSNGNLIASVSLDQTIKLWNTNTGEVITTIQAPLVTCCAFHPNLMLIVSGDVDGSLKLWDGSAQNEIAEWKGHLETIYSCAFSPDGKMIATGSEDRTIKLWNLSTLTKIGTLRGHQESVNSCAFSPDGKIIVSGSADRTIKLWDVSKQYEITTLRGHNNYVLSCVFSSDGSLVASASFDKTIKIWEVRSRREIKTILAHTREVRSCSFSPDARLLISGGWDKILKVCQVDTGKELVAFPALGNILTCDFSPCGNFVCAGDEGEHFYILRLVGNYRDLN